MPDAVYEKLAEAMDRLPNGFPRTPSRVELSLLEKMFTADEAAIVSHLTGKMEDSSIIAARAGQKNSDIFVELKKLARRGLVWIDKKTKPPRFRLAPFVVGIFEAQLENMDKEMAELFDKYMADGGAAGIMKYDPALHRVIPAQGAINAEWVLPYDDVKAILMKAQQFSVRDCICRVQRSHLGHRCEFPLHNCLSFAFVDMPPTPNDITREEAMTVLDNAEDIGLVHTVSNVIDGVGYVCNCCGCCCAILRGITEFGLEKSVAYANYYAEVDPDLCQNCGTCIERCQVNAIIEADDVSLVEREKCIGCGLCVTGCEDEAVKLFVKPEEEIVHPPVNFAAWESERLRSRGLAQ